MLIKPTKPTKDIARFVDDERRKLAKAKTVPEVDKIERRVSAFKTVVKKAGGNRDQINSIADLHIDTVCRGGGMLIDMAASGERAHIRTRGSSRPKGGYTNPLTLQDLNFSESRSRRWQLAARLARDAPEALIEYREKTKAQPDRTRCVADIIRISKLRLGKQRRDAEVTPTVAKIVRASWDEWLPAQTQCDVLLTDPPYSTDVEDIRAFASAWVPVALAKVKQTGRAYICIGAYPIELHAYLSVPPPPHLILSQVLVWTYRNRVGPSPTHDYKLNWQAILYYRGTEAPPLNCSRAVSDYPDLNEQFSVQDINLPDPRRHEAHLAHWHAWQKPDELCERLVRHASHEGDLILDPFAGTGSFLLAAARLGRKALGCDKDRDMVRLALQRGCRG